MPLIKGFRNETSFSFVFTPLESRAEDGRIIEAAGSYIALMDSSGLVESIAYMDFRDCVNHKPDLAAHSCLLFSLLP